MLWWKENINMDASLKTRRDRNLAALAMVLPFCLLATRFNLYSLDFMSEMSETARLGITIGVFVAYLIIRITIAVAIKPRRVRGNLWHAATTAEYTFFIPLTLILLIAGGLLSMATASSDIPRYAMIWLSGAIYIVFLVRKLQIFSSYCNLFRAFLYLCALEILPTGVLIASAVIF